MRNQRFQVVGRGGRNQPFETAGAGGGYYDSEFDNVSGDVMGVGDVMGEGVGAGIDPYAMQRMAANILRLGPGGGMVGVQSPFWRQRQIAPGVQAPDEGLVPLPLHGLTGSDTFSLNQQNITFLGSIQKPFRGERLLIDVVRTGTTAVGRLLGQLFVGTDLQQADIDGFDLQQVGSSQAFGVRLTMKSAQPGVAIKVPTRLSSAITGTDTIFVTMTLLGRIIH